MRSEYPHGCFSLKMIESYLLKNKQLDNCENFSLNFLS